MRAPYAGEAGMSEEQFAALSIVGKGALIAFMLGRFTRSALRSLWSCIPGAFAIQSSMS